MTKRICHIDFESFSEADIRQVGSYAYCQHKTTTVLCMSYSWDEEETIHRWIPKFFGERRSFPIEVADHLEEGGLYTAHHAAFEWAMLMFCLHIETVPSQIRDTKLSLAVRTLPQSLGEGAKVIGKHLKSEEGKKIMLQLCRPRTRDKATGVTKTRWIEAEFPEKYQALYDYCDDDVRAQKGIWYGLPQPTKREQGLYELVFQANIDGLPIDVEGCNRMIALVEAEQTLLTDECVELTGSTPTQRAQILEWLQQYIEIENLQAATVDNLLLKGADAFPENVHRVLYLRRMGGKSSTAKYQKFLDTMGRDEHIHFTMVPHGAKTGRATGADAQTSNLPRPTIKGVEEAAMWLHRDPEVIHMSWPSLMDVASSCIRSMIKAPEGYEFVQGDYSQIESRVLNWGAGQQDAIDRFARGEDPYMGLAATIYHKDLSEITKGGIERQIAKSAVLGAGFQMGPDAFITYCANSGIDIDKDEAKNVIKVFRKEHAKVVSFWYDMEAAAVAAIENKGVPQHLNGKCILQCNGPWLIMKLPSGRCIYWYQPKIKEERTPWGTMGKKISFFGKYRNGNAFGRVTTYGGDLVQSWTQATARDLLMFAWDKVSAAGYDVRLTVYDEIVCLQKIGELPNEKLCAMMVDAPEWAEGLPVASDGWNGPCYRK